MKTIHASPLAAKCAAQNSANAEANRFSALVTAGLAPFIGKKVIKTTDRRMTASALAILPESAPGVDRWLAHADRGVCFSFRACELSASGRPDCQIGNYAEAYAYVGEVDAAGTLIKVCEPTAYPVNFDPARIAELRNIAETAAKAARDAESACGPFGLFDR